MPADVFEVYVDNVGRVHEGADLATALSEYKDWVEKSKRGEGRAAMETVTLLQNGHIVVVFLGFGAFVIAAYGVL